MNAMKMILLTLIILFFQGCGTPKGSHSVSSPEVELATIFSTVNAMEESAWHWDSFILKFIDNKPVHYGMGSHTKTPIKIDPGKRDLVIESAFKRGLTGPGPYHAFLTIETNIQPGMTYKINGKVDNNLMVAWLEDELGNKVSNEVQGPYTDKPVDVIVPIIIPQ